MAKFITVSYGSFEEDDTFDGYMIEGGKVYRISRREGSLPKREETNMTMAEYKAIPAPETRL